LLGIVAGHQVVHHRAEFFPGQNAVSDDGRQRQPARAADAFTAVLNANARWGPGLIYEPPVAAMRVGDSAPILGKTSDGG